MREREKEREKGEQEREEMERESGGWSEEIVGGVGLGESEEKLQPASSC